MFASRAELCGDGRNIEEPILAVNRHADIFMREEQRRGLGRCGYVESRLRQKAPRLRLVVPWRTAVLTDRFTQRKP